ncbi:MAG: polyprenyl diphosphate synthase [Candidatus Bathyarchaeota archaeon]|nr:polyprenyl diphosphate synthase [Candidatus Bathyarchaeota archaeon]MCZ2808145.1 polyprenyl diphosphate synthase [Candidatus Bathyarchaeota archaeon]UCC27399.1 MAG: di-trans,poly-cis-decaprenylcistransferase [Candidatus Bathyarchaeota archaeon]UCD40256.1 MAG: di-trans,poly-cis-decaprenylcistransferase [Candidatus Bathyarchaeota archaeon]
MLKTLLSVTGVYKVYEKWLRYQVKAGKVVPEHIAIILDGNRRWASAKALNPWIGHQFGAERIRNLLDWCLDLKVKSITLYAFSTENFQRPEPEIKEIMKITEEKLRELLADERIHKNRVRFKVIGRRNLLPSSLQRLIDDVEDATKDYDESFLNVALAYGGRAEIVDAAKKIARKVENGELSPDVITERVFENHLYTAHLPKQDPDLIIRTSGEERLSGFLLWQSAYSELCFLDVYWPGFRRIDLLRAVRTYQTRKRRFGT